MFEKITTLDGKTFLINLDKCVIMEPRENGNYTLFVERMTSCDCMMVFKIDRKEAEKLAGDAIDG